MHCSYPTLESSIQYVIFNDNHYILIASKTYLQRHTQLLSCISETCICFRAFASYSAIITPRHNTQIVNYLSNLPSSPSSAITLSMYSSLQYPQGWSPLSISSYIISPIDKLSPHISQFIGLSTNKVLKFIILFYSYL